MVRNRFESQLAKLNEELVEMGSLCEEAIEAAVKALMEDDKELAKKTIEMDKHIDQKEKDIESLCLKLLLQQQPVARDLRLISAALKMITDMERIGDQAADISEIVTVADLSVHEHFENTYEMAKATIKMVRNSIEAFVERDLVLAKEVMRSDDIVDDLFDVVRNEVIKNICSAGDAANTQEGLEKLGVDAVDILMIAKYFERIGDHATNIAEWVEFSITGTHKGY